MATVVAPDGVARGSLDRLNIVIIGGGVIGASAAYYITHHPSYSPDQHSVTLLEASRLAGGASGKAGGLLAQWAYPGCLVSLSFDLHAELAAQHDGASAWGYRTIRCGKLTARDRCLDGDGDDGVAAPGLLSWAARYVGGWVPMGKQRELDKHQDGTSAIDVPEDLDWFRGASLRKYEDIAPQRETAQVHPHQFTLAMANLAKGRGAKILTGAAVEEIEYKEIQRGGVNMVDPTAIINSAKAVRGVRCKSTNQSTSIPADIVILAAGPWTPDLFPPAPVHALRTHSVTIKPSRHLSAYCLFTDITVPATSVTSSPSDKEEKSSWPGIKGDYPRSVRVVSPEIYSRPNDEVYIAGEGDTRRPLPSSTEEVEIDLQACRLIEQAASGVSDELRDGQVTARRACYLPTVSLPSGNPLLGPTWIGGLLLAAGHSCWGIQNAPATGKLLSEMVFDGEAKSSDISALDPRIVI